MTTATKLPAISAARDVIEACANGLPLKASLREAGLTAADFNNVLSSDRELSVAYARATEIRADLLADEVITIADCEATDPQRARNQIQARQWLAGKLHAKRYGDRIDLNVTQTIDIGSTLAEARARIVRPVSDQQETIDAEYQVIEPKITLKPSDN